MFTQIKLDGTTEVILEGSKERIEYMKMVVRSIKEGRKA